MQGACVGSVPISSPVTARQRSKKGPGSPRVVKCGLTTVVMLAAGCGSGNVTNSDGSNWDMPVAPGVTPVTPTMGEGTQGVPTGGSQAPAPGVSPTSSTTAPGVPGATPPTAPATPTADLCETPQPGRSPLRRLTRFEYSNTIEALLNDASSPGQELPAELLGNGFGNDADNQPTSPFLVEQYNTLAAELAPLAMSPEVASRYDDCVLGDSPDESQCAQAFITKFAEAAYRRPLESGEAQELLTLQQTLRTGGDFSSSVLGVVEAILQSPDFLYRIEQGEPGQGVRRLTGHEMATRLSYFLWASPPDAELQAAAVSGVLSTPEGVAEQATRLLDAPKARNVVQFFFDSYLPISNLTDQTRDKALFPTFSAEIGSLQREEVSQLIMHQMFEAEGTWSSILTAPYTFVNEQLANFYGIDGVQGDEFVKVDLDTTKRLGLLTLGGMLTGTTVTNTTNPVRRGGFVLSHLLCIEVPLPSEELAASIKPPDTNTGSTGRERYTAHSEDPKCAGCHALLDPPGFGLENFDAVGLWRDQENGVTIDASGNLSGIGEFSGPVELVQRLAENPNTYSCFAQQWQKFGYGRKLDTGDSCNTRQLSEAFEQSGYDIKQLIQALIQTDGFQYLNTEDQI